jgi:hypothetical protein
MDEYTRDMLDYECRPSLALEIIEKHTRLKWLSSEHWRKLNRFGDINRVFRALYEAACPMRPVPQNECEEFYDVYYNTISDWWKGEKTLLRAKKAKRKAFDTWFYREYRKSFSPNGRGRKRDLCAFLME